jgi:peptide/nickel transport system substrate-binding protein
MKTKKAITKTPLTRRRFLKLSAASAALTLSPALWPRPSWSAEGNILKVRDYSDFKSLDPAYFLAVPEENINAALYNKLISFKPGRKWEWELEAAKSILQIDPTHIAFELKEGIIHSGGFGEMTAEDVKYSFERVADPTSMTGGRLIKWR